MAQTTQLQTLARTAWQELARVGVKSLLAEPDHNPKLAKNLGVGVLTAPLHLAPARLSGYEVCPMRTAGCTAACLHTAGNPAYLQGKNRARIARTRAYFRNRRAFMIALAADIEKLQRRARKLGMQCGVRLNATSDIPWESVPVTVGDKVFPNLMTMFPNVTFYDYTKRSNRRDLPPNYKLTFSLAENNEQEAIAAYAAGMNIAAVFDVSRGKPLPRAYQIAGILLPVIDGDEHDFRPIDPRGVIVGLRAKGKARHDSSGFVRLAV